MIAAFNGGFTEGRVAVPLRPGRGSIVTYRNGTTQIGTWGAGVPIRGQPIASVPQNLSLLVIMDALREPSKTAYSPVGAATVGGVNGVARSALGIDGAGRLIWAASENLLPSQLARAPIAAGAQRAVELDITRIALPAICMCTVAVGRAQCGSCRDSWASLGVSSHPTCATSSRVSPDETKMTLRALTRCLGKWADH